MFLTVWKTLKFMFRYFVTSSVWPKRLGWSPPPSPPPFFIKINSQIKDGYEPNRVRPHTDVRTHTRGLRSADLTLTITKQQQLKTYNFCWLGFFPLSFSPFRSGISTVSFLSLLFNCTIYVSISKSFLMCFLRYVSFLAVQTSLVLVLFPCQCCSG